MQKHFKSAIGYIISTVSIKDTSQIVQYDYNKLECFTYFMYVLLCTFLTRFYLSI
nr:MAG TPA: hypothetical protein [Caudoviricetes sp.]